MKREISPIHLALILILGCILFRMFNSCFPGYIPNISPLMAIAYIGAMYLPRRWGWLVGPVAFIITDLAFLKVNYLTDRSGDIFSLGTLVSLGIYALVGGLGILLSTRKTLPKILTGSVACSLFFYVISNTFSWAHDVAIKMTPGYTFDVAGWWQANTVGLPGYIPTWVFLRNGIAGDLFFVLVLLLALDRDLLFGRSTVKATSASRAV